MKPYYVREVTLVYGKSKMLAPRALKDHEDVASFAREVIGNRVTESILAIAVTARHKPMAWSVIATGTPTLCIIQPSDVLRFVLLSGCPGFFLAHNHPSNDVSPSDDDVRLTRNLLAASKLLGLTLIDHVIVAEEGSISLRADPHMIGGW